MGAWITTGPVATWFVSNTDHLKSGQSVSLNGSLVFEGAVTASASGSFGTGITINDKRQ